MLVVLEVTVDVVLQLMNFVECGVLGHSANG